MAEQRHPSPSTIAGHELSDLNPKKIALFGIVLTAVIIAALLVSYALFHLFYSTITRARLSPTVVAVAFLPRNTAHVLRVRSTHVGCSHRRGSPELPPRPFGGVTHADYGEARRRSESSDVALRDASVCIS